MFKDFSNWFNRRFGSFFNPPYKQGKEKQNSIYR